MYFRAIYPNLSNFEITLHRTNRQRDIRSKIGREKEREWVTSSDGEARAGTSFAQLKWPFIK